MSDITNFRFVSCRYDEKSATVFLDYAFDDEESAQDAIKKLRRADDDSEYRILSRTITEMIGRELEYQQYREITALNDGDAEEARQKQQELIDFVFSSK